MKKINHLIVIIAACLGTQLVVHAQDDWSSDNKKKYEFIRKNSINKVYSTGANDKFTMHNSFGKVLIRTWAKNEVKVDVQIEVTANSDEHAQKIFDNIKVTEKQSGGAITFNTKINGSNNKKNQRSTMSVDYEVWLPETLELTISNDFGTITLPDYKGKVDLTSKFGELNTGKLAQAKKILVEFGKLNTEGANDADMVIKFSKASLGKLTGTAKLKFEFCGASKVTLPLELRSLDVTASYSTVNLRPVAQLQANYHIITSFGTFKNRSDIKFDSDEDEDNRGPKFDYRYDGKNGNGTVPIKAKASFGKIILGEASEKDMEEDDKKSPKKKEVAI
jgi:hypothetical protein